MSLKQTTAKTIKWNTINSVATQVLYAVTGVILANILSKEDYGLVGALLIFQAFAMVLVDSGFGAALLQRKSPMETDYSTVFWFNLGTSSLLYLILFAAAPLIADIFQGDRRLIPLSKVMFLTLIVNALGIIQTNRLMKRMDVRQIALSNTAGLILSGGVGIWLALTGAGAWALVWQTLTLSTVKSGWLWVTERWMPRLTFSLASLRGIVRLGGSVAGTSLLNTFFLQAYSFVTGAFYQMSDIGIYTQGDKWSKMCVSSLSQVLTSSFLPVLSSVQNDSERYGRLTSRMNRMTAYLVFPIFIGVIVEAKPIFHILFGTKWDASIILFQLLLLRGIFTVFTSLYTNYLLSLGHAGTIARLEVLRDVVALAGLAVTFPVMADTLPDNPVWGVSIMLWGQVAAAIVAWALTVRAVHRLCGISGWGLMKDYIPYAAMAVGLGIAMFIIGNRCDNPWLAVGIETVVGGGIYLIVNQLQGSRIQADALSYLRGRM